MPVAPKAHPLHPTATKHAYIKGAQCREQNKTKNNCPFALYSQMWIWWVAGWNDKDIEYETHRKH